jgi:hypothetical protein
MAASLKLRSMEFEIPRSLELAQVMLWNEAVAKCICCKVNTFLVVGKLPSMRRPLEARKLTTHCSCTGVTRCSVISRSAACRAAVHLRLGSLVAEDDCIDLS